MEVSSRTFISCIMIVETYSCGAQMPRQFLAPPINREDEENSKLENVVDLTRPALHTLLKGLAALLLQLYPDLTPKPPPPSPPKKEKQEEPIRIFRQIMQLPGPLFPLPSPSAYYPGSQSTYRQQTLHPQEQPPPSKNEHAQQQTYPGPPPSQSQATPQCFLPNPCCHQQNEVQPNPFDPDHYTTC